MSTRSFISSILLLILTFTTLRAESDGGDIQTKSFTVSKGGSLEISISTGDIVIIPWEKNEVFVKPSRLDGEDFDELKMSQNGNTISIRSSAWGDGDGRLEVNIPSHFDVQARTTYGEIRIQGPLKGSVRGSTSAGEIRLADIDGPVDMNTSGGDIRTGNISGEASLRTSGGDIRMGVLGGEADINTSGGEIRIERAGNKLWARTSGGDMFIGDVAGDVMLSTAGGTISVGNVSGNASLSTAGGDIELQRASGTVTAKTAGGDIRLDNITGSVEAKTAGGDLDVELVPGGMGPSRLSSAAGDIRLYLPENSKASITARIRVQGRWRELKDEFDIRSDFKADSYSKDDDEREIRASYTLNGGGETISLETTMGNIEIRKAGSRKHKNDQ